MEFLLLLDLPFCQFESKRSFKLHKLHLPKEVSLNICKFFLMFASVDLLHQMTGLSLYAEKLIQSSPHTHTHPRTHTRTHMHIINLMTYLDRSTARFLFNLLEKGLPGQNCFHQTKCGWLRVI